MLCELSLTSEVCKTWHAQSDGFSTPLSLRGSKAVGPFLNCQRAGLRRQQKIQSSLPPPLWTFFRLFSLIISASHSYPDEESAAQKEGGRVEALQGDPPVLFGT